MKLSKANQNLLAEFQKAELDEVMAAREKIADAAIVFVERSEEGGFDMPGYRTIKKAVAAYRKMEPKK